MSAYFTVGGFDRDNGSERDRPPDAEALGDSSVQGGELRIAVETRTRGEAHADLRQVVTSGWDRNHRYQSLHGELAMFRTERAGLPAISSEEAVRYVERHRAGRPWLRRRNAPRRKGCGSSWRPTRAAGTGTFGTRAG